VQVSARSGIECVLSHIERNTQPLDDQLVSLAPTVTAADAVAAVHALATARAPNARVATTEPTLAIFAPSVLDAAGPMRLVWRMDVSSPDQVELNERVLADAHTGEIVRQIPRYHAALNRRIYDANNSTNSPAVLARSEGDAATGQTDVDNAYDFVGDTYNFYKGVHGRDSVDGMGVRLNCTVRYCEAGGPCPLRNAYGAGNDLWFGEGFAVDDVVAHEFTHGVTDATSDLDYQNASGAINESMSDIWGEFVDLTNTSGDDQASRRWLVGEDLPGGAIRSMRNPPAHNHPDRLGSEHYYRGTNDHGGVHSNSGVNNKLCYLLTDGDTFNGQTVSGMGLTNVAMLYYEVNAHLLGSSANWTDLYHALVQAAVNLGWSTADRANLARACVAVDFASGVYVDRNNACLLPSGQRQCSLNVGGPFLTVARGAMAVQPDGFLFVRTGSYNETLTINKRMTIYSYDGQVTIGR